MAQDNMGKGLLIGFLTGSIVGSVIALLYAPKSGKELRGDIKIKSDEFIDDAETYLEEAKSYFAYSVHLKFCECFFDWILLRLSGSFLIHISHFFLQ